MTLTESSPESSGTALEMEEEDVVRVLPHSLMNTIHSHAVQLHVHTYGARVNATSVQDLGIPNPFPRTSLLPLDTGYRMSIQDRGMTEPHAAASSREDFPSDNGAGKNTHGQQVPYNSQDGSRSQEGMGGGHKDGYDPAGVTRTLRGHTDL